MSEQFGRRDLLKRAAVAGAGMALAGGAASAETQKAFQIAQAANTVPRKKLGNTGADIPIIVLGCSQKFDPTYDKVLHGVFKEGVNYLDAAQAYAGGQCHKSLAAFIEQVGRKNLWITSKVMLSGKTWRCCLSKSTATETSCWKCFGDCGCCRTDCWFTGLGLFHA